MYSSQGAMHRVPGRPVPKRLYCVHRGKAGLSCMVRKLRGCATQLWFTRCGSGFSPGMGPMPWTINAEIYETPYRSHGTAIATAVNWVREGGMIGRQGNGLYEERWARLLRVECDGQPRG